MERLITVKDIRERYSCSNPTARRYLRQMFHYENPLTAPLWAMEEWEKNRECFPSSTPRRREANKKPERVIVPRKREAK